MGIMVVGDIHGDPTALLAAHAAACLRNDVTAIVQVGDFGIDDRMIAWLKKIKLQLPVYVIDGNHEDFDVVARLRNGSRRQAPLLGKQVYLCPRGSVFRIDGRECLMLGGAGSIDKGLRLKFNMPWYEAEQITDEDVKHAMMHNPATIDLMFTHCPPQSIIQEHFETGALRWIKCQKFGVPVDWSDPSADQVEKVWRYHGEVPLYCGHMHRKVQDGNVRILDIDEYVVV